MEDLEQLGKYQCGVYVVSLPVFKIWPFVSESIPSTIFRVISIIINLQSVRQYNEQACGSSYFATLSQQLFERRDVSSVIFSNYLLPHESTSQFIIQ